MKFESFKNLLLFSLCSLLVLCIFKLYAMGAMFAVLFNCCIREEDKRRKLTYRALMFSEFRMQAMNVDYIEYNKRKSEFWFGLIKGLLVDIPMIVMYLYYLLMTDCGTKNANTIIYIGLVMHILSLYFGFVIRFITLVYHVKRANAYKRKVMIKVSNLSLSNYGFRNIRGKLSVNKKVDNLIISGETYEYLHLDEAKMKKLIKLVNILPEKKKLEFLDFDKVKIDHIRQAKSLFTQVIDGFPRIKYLTLQQCYLCANFNMQMKKYLDGNDSLLRFSLIMNKLREDQVLEAIETSLEHPNMEVLQIAEKLIVEEDEKSEQSKLKENQLNKVSIMKGIQVRLQQNESLKKLEIRYFALSRQMMAAIFRGVTKNRCL